ncbi:MAG: porin family protein [Parachlamydia sp.]|nr:porin family protein [Parachlamydia sp.]
MMKKLMALMTVLVAFAAPNAAQAFFMNDNFPQGLYLGAFGAADFPADKHHSHSHSGSGNHGHEKKLETGYFVAGSLGYRLCDGWRGEVEGGYHHNSRKKHHHNDSSNHNHRRHGDANTWSVMFNGYYDIPTCWCVKPFVGAGIGYADTEHKRHHRHHSSSAGVDCAGGCGSSSSHHHHRHHDKNGFAWQLIAGIAYPVCDGWDVSLQYRYFNPTAVSRLHYNDVGIGLAYAF